VVETLQSVVSRALEAYADLAELGESVEDEWSYVNDLADAWRQRLADFADGRGAEHAPDAVVAAVDRVIGEVRLVEDPHRAIDWLSTFPQVVLLATGELP
jgi:hypothetical protein